MSRGHGGGKSSDRLRQVGAGLSSLRQTGRRGLMLFSGKISLAEILTSSQVITYTCWEEKAEQHGLCFPGSTGSFPIWFSLGLIWLTLVSQTEWCRHGKAYRLCVPPGVVRLWVPAQHSKREEGDFKGPEDWAHVYFSDSNYFVWKTVNTITLTTELGGFEGLAHCFPSKRQRVLRITAASLQDSGGSVCLHSFSFQKWIWVVTGLWSSSLKLALFIFFISNEVNVHFSI